MYAPVSTSTQASREASLELSDQEGFDSNLRCAGMFAIAITAIVIANYFLNQLQVASSSAINVANYAVFTQRVSTALHFSTFEMYSYQMQPLVADMESVLEFLPGTLQFHNDSCVVSGVCDKFNFTPMQQATFSITFSASGALISGHLWNLNFQAQTIPKYSGQNTLPSCPAVVSCTLGN